MLSHHFRYADNLYIMRKAFILVAGTYGNAFLCTSLVAENAAKLNSISLSLSCNERINVKRLSSLKLPINILDAVWSVRFFTVVLNKLYVCCFVCAARQSLHYIYIAEILWEYISRALGKEVQNHTIIARWCLC